MLPSWKTEGAGKTGCALHRGLVCKLHKEIRTRAYRFSGGIPAFLRDGFTVYRALSPVTGFVATVARKQRLLLTNLTTSIGAPGPHDFAVRLSHARQSQLPRPPHPTARFVTCARPSVGEMRGVMPLICRRVKRNIFRAGLDR